MVQAIGRWAGNVSEWSRMSNIELLGECKRLMRRFYLLPHNDGPGGRERAYDLVLTMHQFLADSGRSAIYSDALAIITAERQVQMKERAEQEAKNQARLEQIAPRGMQ